MISKKDTPKLFFLFVCFCLLISLTSMIKIWWPFARREKLTSSLILKIF